MGYARIHVILYVYGIYPSPEPAALVQSDNQALPASRPISNKISGVDVDICHRVRVASANRRIWGMNLGAYTLFGTFFEMYMVAYLHFAPR